MFSSFSSTIITGFDISQPSGKPGLRATLRGGALATTLAKHASADRVTELFPVGAVPVATPKHCESVPSHRAAAAVVVQAASHESWHCA